MTAVLYGNFAFFREQLCTLVCPYGRMQSALLDRDSMIVAYDAARGEPRGGVAAQRAAQALVPFVAQCVCRAVTCVSVAQIGVAVCGCWRAK